jgi:SAM-dependent methyltransferase
LYPARLSPDALSPRVFSARRLPDRLHYRLVRCNACGLVRSDPAAAPGVLSDLYADSSLDYGEELPNLQATYGRYLARLARYELAGGDLLEIGCGNGFFLEEALRQGYRVHGVEPSREAAALAVEGVRGRIVVDVMRPGLFEPETLAVICLFQVIDHLPDPGAVVEECFRLLRPGGVILCLTHNAASLSARLLGERSPIVDVEHTYLFSPATLSRLCQGYGLEIRQVGAAVNRYSLHYLVRLLPLPAGMKSGLLRALGAARLGRVPVWMPLGNMYLVAQKPATQRAAAPAPVLASAGEPA